MSCRVRRATAEAVRAARPLIGGTAAMAVRRSRGGPCAAALGLLALGLLAAGCGKKGNPLPPARTIPNPTKDLTAAQRGEQVVLRFAYPQTTTAGAKLPGLAAVEVWSVTRPLPPGAAELPALDIREFTGQAASVATLRDAELQSAVEGGQVVVRLPLPAVPPAPPPSATPAPSPATEAVPTPSPAPAAPRSAYVYAVRTVAEGEGAETSAWSNLATLVPQPPPAPTTGLRVEPRAHAIELAWEAPAGAAGFVVYRRPAASRTYGAPLTTLPAEARTYLDETAKYGERYIFTVTALGGTGTPKVESGFGEESEVDYQDRFAPAPPPDLEALPQQGGVHLVWRPSSDADATGYIVYRQDEGGEWRRITPEPIPDPKLADENLASGRLFRYRVSAVDAAGNEGSPTPEVEVRPR
jgi:hypothetical protein